MPDTLHNFLWWTLSIVVVF